jgi:hypothetical protein
LSSSAVYVGTRTHYGRAMEKKRTRPLKTLRLRKEALKALSTTQLVQVEAGALADPWDPPPDTAYPICQVA